MCTYSFNTPLHSTLLHSFLAHRHRPTCLSFDLLSNGQQPILNDDAYDCEVKNTLFDRSPVAKRDWRMGVNAFPLMQQHHQSSHMDSTCIDYIPGRERERGRRNNNINNDRSSFRGRKILIELFEIQFWTHRRPKTFHGTHPPGNSTCNLLLPYPVWTRRVGNAKEDEHDDVGFGKGFCDYFQSEFSGHKMDKL